MDFICTACNHRWSARKNSKLVKGYGCPPCPECGAPSVDPNDYGDCVCHFCGHHFRKFGNGGLTFGMVPKCPECGSSFVGFDE